MSLKGLNVMLGYLMELKLDDNSKILGTYEVKSNGIVTGFSKYIGNEVLVILLSKKEAEINGSK